MRCWRSLLRRTTLLAAVEGVERIAMAGRRSRRWQRDITGWFGSWRPLLMVLRRTSLALTAGRFQACFQSRVQHIQVGPALWVLPEDIPHNLQFPL